MAPEDPAPFIEASTEVLRTSGWADYALIDSGSGRKLERYGEVRVVRPEPQCWWPPRLSKDVWDAADAVFDPNGDEDQGRWRLGAPLADRWPLSFGDARFYARLTPFRHLAFFPEQAANWAVLDARLRARTGPLRVLNLFGYTGVATLVALAAGAEVTHVDASKKSVAWARENAALSCLGDRPVRWIVEDARRYVQREVRRGSLYDVIVMDPPKYGRGPGGEIWRLHEDLAPLVADCAALLAPEADHFLLNAYAERLSSLSLAHLLRGALGPRGGRVSFGELALEERADAAGPARAAGLSFFARWTAS